MSDHTNEDALGYDTLAMGVKALHKELKERLPKGAFKIRQWSLFDTINLAARAMPENAPGSPWYPHSITNVDYEIVLSSEGFATVAIHGELIDQHEAYGGIQLQVVVPPPASRETVRAVRTRGDEALLNWTNSRSRRSAARLAGQRITSPVRGGGWDSNHRKH